MQLSFIRHAQSENNVLLDRTGSYDGRSEDPELSDLGILQVKQLAEFLSRPQPGKQINKPSDPQNVQGFQLTHLYTSLMVRAVATGVGISKTTRLSLLGWPDLHEVGGIYQKDRQTGMEEGRPGHCKSYFEQRFPTLILPCSLGEEGWWNKPHEGKQEGLLRARRVYQEIVMRHGRSNDRVGLISHGDFYQMFLSVVLDLPADNPPFFEINNAAVSRFDFESNKVRVVYLNRLDYMAPELIT